MKTAGVQGLSTKIPFDIQNNTMILLGPHIPVLYAQNYFKLQAIQPRLGLH